MSPCLWGRVHARAWLGKGNPIPLDPRLPDERDFQVPPKRSDQGITYASLGPSVALICLSRWTLSNLLTLLPLSVLYFALYYSAMSVMIGPLVLTFWIWSC
jgi:hypothetical protein